MVIELPGIPKEQIIAFNRQACLSSCKYFTRYFFKARFGKRFTVAEHHVALWELLQQVLTGKIKRLLISVPPRYGKTEIAVKNFMAMGLALNPAAKFIHLSYSDELALDNSEAVKDIVTSVEYQELFPEVEIKKDSKAKDKWYTTAGGGILAKASGGSVTGFGAGLVDEDEKDKIERLEKESAVRSGLSLEEWKALPTAKKISLSDKALGEDIDEFLAQFNAMQGFGGAIIIDDPLKPEDADSDTIRNRVNNRFDSTIRNRVNSINTPIIVIGHRLHENDLIGYLQREDEAEEWTVVNLAAIKEDGTPLYPQKHTIEVLRALERANSVVFDRQYMGNPYSVAGLLFPRQHLQYFDYGDLDIPLDDPDFIFIPVDPAGDGGDDFGALETKLIGKLIYVTDVIYNTDAEANEERVEKMALRNMDSTVQVEGVLGWKETANRIRERLQDKNHRGEFRITKPRVKKHTRIVNRSSFIKNYFVFRKDWQDRPQYAKFMRNLTSYLKVQEAGRGNKHDDAPDLCEQAGSYYEKSFPELYK